MTTRPSCWNVDVALHQRVRADDQMDGAGCELGELLAPRGAGRRAGQQRDAEARRLQQPARCSGSAARPGFRSAP